MNKFYVGLMSGTSMDGIDAVLVSFGDSSVAVHATHSEAYPATLKTALIAAARKPLDVEPDPSGELDRQVGEAFSAAALAVIEKSGIDASEISAIGSHGQTLRHQPNAAEPFSLQIGDADIIAAATGVPTVANFRQADIAAGGQGAPLVPPFHKWLFGGSNVNRVVLNIGGIANITVLPVAGAEPTGFDTGPGNGLMDAWIREHLGEAYDNDGEWGASGVVLESLLERFLHDAYFELAPPKSTGFEYFNPGWLASFGVQDFQPVDVQATLCELTARSIALAIQDHASGTGEVFVCGGGVHNSRLIARLRQNLQGVVVASTSAIGLDPDWVEAVAFAWLAQRSVDGLPGNLPSVTGASHAVILGELHYPQS
jgi:anhydro-N-acetylmuramic acid kinase